MIEQAIELSPGKELPPMRTFMDDLTLKESKRASSNYPEEDWKNSWIGVSWH